jgi:hypothetical protein
MGDLLPILVLAIVGIMAGALFDCITTDERAIRHFPKKLWIVSIALLPGIGGLLWFTSGRLPAGTIGSHIATGHPAGRARIETRVPSVEVATPRTLAPDDDPEFLAHLAEMNRAARANDTTVGMGTTGRNGSDTLHDEERLRQRGEPPIED